MDDGGGTAGLAPHQVMEVIDNLIKALDYKALKEVINCLVREDTFATILPAVIFKLKQTTELEVGQSDIWVRQGELQASLCGVLKVVIRKLGSSDRTRHLVLRDSNQVMELIHKIFSFSYSAEHEEARLAVVEEALLIVGALAYTSGPEFGKHVQEVSNYVKMGLQVHQIYSSSMSVIRDICCAVGDKCLPFYNEIMSILYSNLRGDELPHSLRPLIFSCFGDIALASGVQFEKYLQFVVDQMKDAATECGNLDYSDEYRSQMRLNIFKTYSAICQGFKDTKVVLIVSHVSDWLQFIRLTVETIPRNESVFKAAIAVLGDLGDILSSSSNELRFRLNGTWICPLLKDCLISDDMDTGLRETAQRTIRKFPALWGDRIDVLAYGDSYTGSF